MPKQLVQYRVFIASPGGLGDERTWFRRKLEKFTATHSEPNGVVFHPVGWEETIGGVGRPQELINRDLEECDYAIFVLHDRWGSRTGPQFGSGVEEEFFIAEEMYRKTKLRNIVIFFKSVDQRQLRDPGPQLQSVLDFKRRIEEEKRYHFKQYGEVEEFSDVLESHLADWLRRHTRATSGLAPSGLVLSEASPSPAPKTSFSAVSPGFAYWIDEATRLSEATPPDNAGALFCSSRAIAAAGSDIDWARAMNLAGIVHFNIGRQDEAASTFKAIADRLGNSDTADALLWCAKALVNHGISLAALGRGEEEIAVYDDLLGRFGTATELPLREHVARALVNKGGTLGALGRGEEAIEVYDDLLGRFGTATELPLREPVARALFNKGVTLGALGRGEEAIAVCDDLLGRFGTATELPLREQVARALVNKGVTLDALGRGEEEIAVYDDLLGRFGTATELPLREQVATGLLYKAITLDGLGRGNEAAAVYDDLLARLGPAPEPPLRDIYDRAVQLKALRRRP